MKTYIDHPLYVINIYVVHHVRFTEAKVRGRKHTDVK